MTQISGCSRVQGMTLAGGNGKTVADLTCNPMATIWHNHGHLTIFIDGQQVALASAIGITRPVY